MSWRSYGGTSKNDNLQNISIGTLVADSLLLRQNYATEFTVQGSMQVLGDVTVQGNSNFHRDIVITDSDLFANRDLYIKRNLYFGRTNQDGPAQSGYSFIHGGSNQIGVNTTTPYTAFDITDVTGSDNILTVRSQTSINRNIIAENNARHGIISYTKDDINTAYSSLQFFNRATINNQISSSTAVQVPDAIIQNKWLSNKNAGILDLQGGYIHMDSSCVVISSRGYSDDIPNYFNEAAIIYDYNQSLYLFDDYNKSSSYAGNALSLISKDTSSNTFLNIATPGKIGLSIGGGAFPYDNTRAMGSIGLKLQNDYSPIQTMVSGTNPLYYKNTLGINTYSPKTESYILDINGPTRIGNGEITKTSQVDIEVTNMIFSRRNTNYGMLCGSPYYTGNRTPPFALKTSTTYDGGITWQPLVSIDTQGALTNTQSRISYMSLYVYDTSYSIIGCSTNTINALYYTNTGGQAPSAGIKPWYKLTDRGVSSYKSYQTIYVADLNDPENPLTQRIFLTGREGQAGNALYGSYFDLSLGGSLTGADYRYTGLPITDLSLATISCCDGCGNILYYAGAGIQKYDVGTASSLQVIKRSDVSYNKIYAYDSSYVIAVGNNVISYTKDGENWTDLMNTEEGSPFGLLNSVFIYDPSNGLVVGSSGEFLYTDNGSISWSTVPNSILNSSGIAGRINDLSNNLTGVVMTDINTFVISDVSQNYSYMDGSNNHGISNILCGYFPNLFNRINNTVFEVSGNMFISGDINVNEGGKIMTTNDTFSLLNERVSNIYFGNSAKSFHMGNQNTATYISGSVFISVDSSLNGNLYVNRRAVFNGDVSANSRVFVGADVSLGSRLFVSNDVSANSRVFVGGDVSLGSRLFVSNDVSANSRVFVGGDVSLGSRLFVSNDVSANSRVFVGGDVSLGSRLFVSNVVSANSRVFVGGDVSLGSRLFILNDVSANSRVFVGGDVSLGGRLYVNYDALINTLTIGRGYGYIATNTAIGYQTLPMNTSGNTNTAVGYQVLYNNKEGSQNVGLGYKSLYNNTLGGSNTGIGYNSLYNNNGGSYNTAIGQTAGKLNTTGEYNTFLGYNTSNSAGTYSYSTAVGNNAAIYGSNQVILGTQSETVIITGDASFNNRLIVGDETTLQRTLYVNDSIITTGDIYATSGVYSNNEFDTLNNVLYVGTGSYSSQVYIGSLLSGKAKTIFLGSDQDTVILRGNVQNKTVSNLVVNSKQITLNEGDTEEGASSYSGITIRDNSNDMAGYILVSTDMSAFNFRATNEYSNRLRFDVNSMTLNGDVATGIMVLKQSTELDSDYTLTVQSIDASSILIRDKNISDDYTQYITTHLTISGGDISANTHIFVGGDVSLNSRLFVGNDVSANSRVFVGGDVSLGSRIFVSGDVSANSRVFVGGDVSLGSRMFVSNDVSANSRMFVGGDVSLGSRLFVSNDVSANSRIFVGGDALINNLTIGRGNGYIATNTALGYKTLNNNTTGSQNVGVGYQALTNNTAGSYNVAIGQNAGNTNTAGNYNTYLGYNAGPSSIGTFSNSTAIGYNASIYGSNQIILGTASDTAIITGDTSANSRLFVGADASLSSRLFVNKDISANARLFIGGDVSLGGLLYIASDVSANARLFIGGDVSLNSRLFVNLDISANSKLFLGGDASLNGRLFIKSDVSANGKLRVGGDISTNGNVFIGGSSGLTVSGGLVTAMNGLAIGLTQLASNTTLDVSGSIYQTNGVIFQF